VGLPGTGAKIGGLVGSFAGPEGAIIGEVVGATVEGLGKLAVSVAGIPSQVDSWAQSLIDSQKDIRMFNGQIANTFAKLRRQEITLGARTARATGGTTEALGSSLMELREEMQPLREIATNVRNIAGSAGAKFATVLVKNFAHIAGAAVGAILGAMAGLATEKAIQKLIDEQKKANKTAQNNFRRAFKDSMNQPINRNF